MRQARILLAIAVAASACSTTEATTSSATSPTAAAVTTTTSSTTTTQAPTTTTTEPPPERTVRTYDVDGVEVIVRTELEELPERAEVIEYSNTIIDSGEGPKLCGGAIMTSYPPQCFGPVIVGLDMSDWAEFASGVSFGERTVVVTWPAVDDRVQHISDSEFELQEPPYVYAALPEHCAGIDRFVSTEALQQYARSVGERSGGLVFTEGGVLFLQVTDDPEPHRAALRQDGREACVVQVGRSEAEVLRIQENLFNQLRGADYASDPGVALGVTSGGNGAHARIDVYVIAADLVTIEAIAALVEDRTALRIIGEGVLLDLD